MATRDDLETELQNTYNQFEQAHNAGARDEAQSYHDRAVDLESQLGYYFEEPSESYDGPALDSPKAVARAEKDIDATEIDGSDLALSAYSGLVSMGANFMTGLERDYQIDKQHRKEQKDNPQPPSLIPDTPGVSGALEVLRTGVDMATLNTASQAGSKIPGWMDDAGFDPSFYGTFVRPWMGKEIGEAGQHLAEWAKEIKNRRSQGAQDASKKPFINDEKFFVNDPSTWFNIEAGGAMPWQDVNAFLIKTAENVPQLTASILSSRFGGQAGAMVKGRQLRKKGVINPEVARKQAASFGVKTGTAAGMGTEYLLVNDSVAAGMDEAFKAHWDKDELWEENDRYTDLVNQGYSRETAKQVVSRELAAAAGNTAGVISMVLGAPMSRFFAKMGLEGAATRMGSALKGFAGESLQEGVQEMTETFTANAYEKTFDPSKPLGEGIIESFFGGAMIGGPIGGIGGAFSGGSRPSLDKDQKDLADSGFTEWRKTANKRSELSRKVGDPKYIEETPADERVADFKELEDLQYREAKAYLSVEKKIRRLQDKRETGPAERKRTDIFSSRYKAVVSDIETARSTRKGADSEAATQAQIKKERDAMVAQVGEDANALSDLNITKDNLAAVSNGEAIDGAAYDQLVEQKFGRWTSKAKNKFVLTPAGRAAQSTIGRTISLIKGKLESGYAGEERRSDTTTREKYNAMSNEELVTVLHTDNLSGMQNARALSDLESDEGTASSYAVADVDSLKWVNDEMGHKAGDKLIKTIGKAFKKAGFDEDAYRFGGDEFILRAASDEEAEESMQKVAKVLAELPPITDESGRSMQPSITWGVDSAQDLADKRMIKMKVRRTGEGKRADRGESPPSMRLAGEPVQLPLLKYSQDEVDILYQQVSQLVGVVNLALSKGEEPNAYAVQRLDALEYKISAIEDNYLNEQFRDSDSMTDAEINDIYNENWGSPGDGHLSQWMDDTTHPEPMSKKQKLQGNFKSMTDEMRAKYEVKASEFYTPITGTYTSAEEVYLAENGAGGARDNLPEMRTDQNGNIVAIEQTEMFQTIDRLLKTGSLPTDVVAWARDESARFKDKGLSIGPTHALMHRVKGYLGMEYIWKGPSPFSGDVKQFNKIHKNVTEKAIPLIHLQTDPIAGEQFYRDVRKGDPVEVLIDGQSVVAFVVVDGHDSVTVRWESDQASLFDPDLREESNSAKFSKQYGWQVSSRMSQGGTAFDMQANAWPGQARLGRKVSAQTDEWVTASEEFNTKVKKYAAISRTVIDAHPNLRRAARVRTTKKNMRKAHLVAKELFATATNLPSINIVNSIADLPRHMQEVLVGHGSSGGGVQGMFDEVNPANGVWVMLGNVVAQNPKMSVESAVTEVLLHETVGHYGLRGVLGSDKVRNSYMDAIEKAWPKEVMAKGREYKLVSGFGKQSVYKSEAHRRLAAEEWFAELNQNDKIIDRSPPQQNLIEKIMSSIRRWLAANGLGKYITLKENDLRVLISQAQRFVQSGRGFSYIKHGGAEPNHMRDANVFTAAIKNEYWNGMRKTTKDERRGMKNKGLEVQNEIHIFPTEGLTRAGYISAFEKLIKDGKVKDVEVEMVGVIDFLETLTNEDIVASSPNNSMAFLHPGTMEEMAKLNAIAGFETPGQYDIRLDISNEIAGVRAEKGETSFELQEIMKKNEGYADPPTDEEKVNAQLRLDEINKAKPPKKHKLHKSFLSRMIEAHSPSVRMVPVGGYETFDSTTVDDENLGPDITPYNYRTFSNSSNIGPSLTFSKYSPVGTDKSKYAIYAFQSENHTFPGAQPGHGLATSVPENETIMHLRVAEARDLNDDLVYDILEFQSDAFQKAVGAYQSQTLKNEALKDARKNLSLLSRSMQVPLIPLTTHIEALMATQSMSSQRINFDDLLTQARAIEISLQDQAYSLKQETKFMDDARAFDYYDAMALLETAKSVAGVLHDVSATHPNDEPVRSAKEADEAAKVARDRFHAAINSMPGPFARVAAKPYLLKKFMNDIVQPLTGLVELDSKDIEALQNKMGESTRSVKVVLSKEFMHTVRDMFSFGINSFDASTIASMIQGKRVEFSAFGWDVGLMEAPSNNINGGVVLTIPDNPEAGASFGEAFKTIFMQSLPYNAAKSKIKSAADVVAEQEQNVTLDDDAEVETEVNDTPAALLEINYRDGGPNESLNVIENGPDGMGFSVTADTYAEKRTIEDMEEIQQNDSWNEHLSMADVTVSGDPLSYQHEGYTSRVTFDDDGDADTSDAMEWIDEEMEDAFREMTNEGGSLYDGAYDGHHESFGEDYPEGTIEKIFTAPIEWDVDPNSPTFGSASQWQEGYLIANDDDTEGYEDNYVRSSFRVGWYGDSSDPLQFTDEEDATKQIIKMIFKLHAETNTPVPVTSQFHVPNPKQGDLLDDIVESFVPPKPKVKHIPIPGVDRKKLRATKISEETLPGVSDYNKAYSGAASIDKIDAATIYDSPTPFAHYATWRTIGLKGALSDAIRRGFRKVVWQSSEANASRGGWGAGEWERLDRIDWKKETHVLQGKETDVYIIEDPNGDRLMLTPDRMDSVVGIDVTKRITAEAKRLEIDDSTNGEIARRNVLDHIVLMHSSEGDGWVVVNKKKSNVEKFDSLAEAQAWQAELVELTVKTENPVKGTLTKEDMGGTINIIASQSLPDTFVHTASSKGQLRGAREAQDKITINVFNKYLKKFGVSVTKSVKVIDPAFAEQAVQKDGARLSYSVSKEFNERHPNPRVEEVAGGYIVLSDLGMLSNIVFSDKVSAIEELDTTLNDAGRIFQGIKVNEIIITDEMVDYFTGGNLPILMRGGEETTTIDGKKYVELGTYDGLLSLMEAVLKRWPKDARIALNYATGNKKNSAEILERAKAKVNEGINSGGGADAETMGHHRKVFSIPKGVVRHLEKKFPGAKASLISDGVLTPDGKVRSIHQDLQPGLETGAQIGLPIMSLGRNHSNPTALKSAMDKIGALPRKITMAERWDDLKRSWKGSLNQGLFDKFYGIKRAMADVGWKGDAAESGYVMARMSTSLESQIKAVMEYGAPVWKDGIMEVEGEGLLDILAPVSNPDTLKKWSAYMVGKRAMRLKEEGREQLFDDEEIAAMIEIGEESTIFEQVAEKYAAFNKKVLDYAEQAGVIDPETRPMWEHADYVPFYRVQDDRIVGPLRSGNGVVDQRSPVRRLKGGEQMLSDIPQNILMNIATLIDSANKNNAAKLTIDILAGTGLMHKVSNVQTTTEMVPMGQVKAKLIEAGMDPTQIPPSALQGMQKMFAIEPNEGPGVITIMREGKRETYQTDDMLLYEALTQINHKQFGKWMNFFRFPKRFLTQMVTLDPGFMARNYMRDLASSYVLSRDTNNPAKHLLESVKGWKQALMNDETMRTMMSAGAAFETGYVNQGDPQAVGKAIKKAGRSRGFNRSAAATVLDTPARLFEAYKAIGTSVENANRLAVYNEAIAKGKSKAQAAFEAKDLMDFSMGGAWAATQFLIQTVPFMGARLQGLHRLGRGAAEHPVAFTMKGLMLTMAGMALFLKFADDERYKKLEDWDKQTYFHFWVGDDHWRLPKPFEIGAVFNTIPEIMFAYQYNESNDAEKLLMKQYGHMLGETFSLNPTPQAFMPVLENSFNYNFFSGRQIVNPFMEQRMPPEQYRASTSPTMIELARVLPEGLDKVSKKYRSPLYLSNLYYGYTGTLGRYAMLASDAMVRKAMDYPEPPSKHLSDYPVVGSFYRGSKDTDIRRTKYEEQFYDLLRETLDIQGSLRFLDKTGQEDRFVEIETDKTAYVDLAKDLNQSRKDVSDINSQIMELQFYKNPTEEEMQKMTPQERKAAVKSIITPEVKRKMIDELQLEKENIYRETYKLRPSESKKKAGKDELSFLINKYGTDEYEGRVTKLGERQPATALLASGIDNLSANQKQTLIRAAGGE